ncbi:uncharacterized protein N0V89_000090 [Didymosphaeria variabile]|uniref:Fucose-specific lectin n=1 Tax=Didymosphaeria variabile TaxID=1932322 RepID=A0A9W8XW45_9PLEO|nr:uncharacterized protein N0V89_000090 [Didymosphaeria variabile]KAJ4359535.1 hypothetical protein N0V89_000090 [Didymosphaeria variabile]
MISSQGLLAVALALTAPLAEAAMGPAFSTGPVGSGSWIREATSTLTLPKAPTSKNGDTSLWVGMGTSNGDLIQSIADNWQSTNWDIFAYTLKKTGDNSQVPIQAPGSTAKQGDKITMHYKYDDASGNYTQYVSVNGNQVSTLSTNDGHAEGFGTAVECAANDCGTIGAHTWSDTQIILNTADPNYRQTMYKGAGVTGDMSTSDGGKTWVVSTISIPQFSFGS